jgi:diguanylate cyclase (GGDEF)-like protein
MTQEHVGLILESPPDHPAQVDELNRRAQQLQLTDARAALALCQQAQAMALRLDYQHGLAHSLLRVSVCQSILEGSAGGEPAALQQAIALMRSLGDQAGEAEVLNHQGNLALDQHDHGRALACFQASLDLRRAVGDRAREAASLNNIALALRHAGQLADALERLQQSLQLAEAEGDARATAYALSNMGAVLAQVGEQPAAHASLDRALLLVRNTTDRALECSVLLGLGRLAQEAGDAERALVLLRTAFDLAQGTGNLGDLAEALLALGQLHQAVGQAEVAAPMLEEALALGLRKGDPRLAAQVLLAQAHLQAGATGAATALALLTQALAQAERAQAEPLIAQAHERLSAAHESLGDLAAALRHYRAFHVSVERLRQQASQRRVRSLLNRQEVDRAERDAQAERERSASLADALAHARQVEQDRDQILAELQAQTTLLAQLAREDGLTGLANRRWLDLQLQREVERARRFGHALAVVMVDIDHFKAVNDQYSHAVGDAALRAVARLLRDGCRSSDVVGRYGGEEFLLILVETPAEQALVLCEKLRQQLRQQDWPALHPRLAQLTVSMGVAALQHDESIEALLARTDRQLYRAKDGGRNQVCADLPGPPKAG